MSVPVVQQVGLGQGIRYAPDLYERITELLADLVLEDLKRYPHLSPPPCIDSPHWEDNTSWLPKECNQ